jgi:2-polyprenyl-3-methyl-5-hydroxy-6-metoxy-1,4-benzoquinol methylase
MGSKDIQGQLWGKRPQNWADIQEQTGSAGYQYVLSHLKLSAASLLLDIGCGSGLFSSLAYQDGASATGIDASEALIAVAKERNPAISFAIAEMEELPFDTGSFDVVCGFNTRPM